MLWAWVMSFQCWLHAKAVLLTGTCQPPHLVPDTPLEYLFWIFFINLACFHRKPFLNWCWIPVKTSFWFLNGFNNNLDHRTQSSHQPSPNNVLLIWTSGQIIHNSWLIIPHYNSWKKSVDVSNSLILAVCPQPDMKPAPISQRGADGSMTRYSCGSLDLTSLGNPGSQVQGNRAAVKFLGLWAPLKEKIWAAVSLLLLVPQLVWSKVVDQKLSCATHLTTKYSQFLYKYYGKKKRQF